MMYNMLQNQSCAVSRAKLVQLSDILYNMRFPILLTEMLDLLVKTTGV